MQFKIYIPFLLALGNTVCYAATSTYDGRPGCKTPGEIGHLYRNFWDPMRYWRCYSLNMEALSESCPDLTGFQQSLGRCVPWKYWKWEIPVYPPSCPTGVMCIHMESTPSTLYPQPLYSQALSQALLPTAPFSQSQPSIQPHFIGPLPPQSYLPSQYSPILHQPQNFVPSQSPQTLNPSYPLMPPQSSQILHPSLPPHAFVPSQSPETLNPSYPLIPSQSSQILQPSLPPQTFVQSQSPETLNPSYPLIPSQSSQILQPSLPSQTFGSTSQSPQILSPPYVLVPSQILNPSQSSQTFVPSSQSPQILNTPYPLIPSLPQYPGEPIG